MMLWFKRIMIASFCVASLVSTGLAIWEYIEDIESIHEYLGFYSVLLIMTIFEGIIKVCMVVIIAVCLIKYGIAHLKMGDQSLQEHYTLTPHIMYPVFIAAFFTTIDTVVFISTLPKSTPDDAFYFFITNMIAAFCDFTLKLSIMIAYHLIIKHVYMKLEQAKWVG